MFHGEPQDYLIYNTNLEQVALYLLYSTSCILPSNGIFKKGNNSNKSDHHYWINENHLIIREKIPPHDVHCSKNKNDITLKYGN